MVFGCVRAKMLVIRQVLENQDPGLDITRFVCFNDRQVCVVLEGNAKLFRDFYPRKSVKFLQIIDYVYYLYFVYIILIGFISTL